MKTRLSFVTNSSSSSYVCEICNQVEAGYDMGFEEAQMVGCQNGHTFCKEHLKGYFDYGDDLSYIENVFSINTCAHIFETVLNDKTFFELLENSFSYDVKTSLKKLKQKKYKHLFKELQYDAATFFYCLNLYISVGKSRESVLITWLEYYFELKDALLDEESSAVESYFQKFNVAYESCIPESACPICNLTHISAETIENVLLNKFNLSKKELEDTIRFTYKNLTELENNIK